MSTINPIEALAAFAMMFALSMACAVAIACIWSGYGPTKRP